MKMNLQFFGGRGAGSGGGGGLPMSFPGGGGGSNRNGVMDAAPGEMATAAEALGTQGRPMNVTTAVSGANPYYNLGAEYQENCQRCVIATEARMRGYDVQALPTYENDTMPRNQEYLQNFIGATTNTIHRSTANASRNEVERQMADMGNGARATMAFNWKGARSGHVINVMQTRGRTRYFDGQTGTEVSASHLFNAISTSGSRGIQLTRVDNLAFSDTVNRAVRPHT